MGKQSHWQGEKGEERQGEASIQSIYVLNKMLLFFRANKSYFHKFSQNSPNCLEQKKQHLESNCELILSQSFVQLCIGFCCDRLECRKVHREMKACFVTIPVK